MVTSFKVLVGELVGELLELFVGEFVGMVVGLLLGEFEGLSIGLSVGLFVCCVEYFVGQLEGDLVD